MIQLTLTRKMTTAQVVETSVTVNNNSPIQDHVHSDDQTQPTFEMTPGFKPFTTIKTVRKKPLRHWCDWGDLVEGTVTRFCVCAASWFLFWRTFFQDLLCGEELLFHRPLDTRERHIISIQDLFGPFWKPYFVFLCKHCRENSLRRGARSHVRCCQCSYKRIKGGV